MNKDVKWQSQELVFEAYEQPVQKGQKLAEKALELDPNNVEAYNYLASIQKDINKVIEFFEKAIKAGEKTLGKKLFEEEKGHFWLIVETRPYMQAKAGLADCLSVTDEVDRAIEIYEEMLELNPGDNQGIRYMLSILLVGKDDLTKFEQFLKNSEDDDCAVWTYNKALYAFKKFGQTVDSEKELQKAHESNKFVIDYMVELREMPNDTPRFIGVGDENEAIVYVNDAISVWHKTQGALGWLHEFKMKLIANSR